MSRTTITSGGEIYTVSPDDIVPAERRFRVFVAGRPTDTQTEQPVAATVTVSDPGFDTTNVRWKKDNWFVIVGWMRWQLPLLPTANQQIHLRMVAENYWPVNIVAAVLQPATGQSPVMVTLPAVQTEMLHI